MICGLYSRRTAFLIKILQIAIIILHLHVTAQTPQYTISHDSKNHWSQHGINASKLTAPENKEVFEKIRAMFPNIQLESPSRYPEYPVLLGI